MIYSSFPTKIQQFNQEWTGLDNTFSSYQSQLQEIMWNLAPRRGEFQTSDADQGNKRNANILDSSGLNDVSTMKAGLTMGIMNPASEWIHLTTKNRAIRNLESVKTWLADELQEMRADMAGSNLYNECPNLLGDTAIFATGAMFIEKDWEHVFSVTVFPIGSYRVAFDKDGYPVLVMRKFPMTCRQLVTTFGMEDGKISEDQIDWSKFSVSVKDAWDNNKRDTYKVDVMHRIGMNHDFRSNALNSKYKRVHGCYYEYSTGAKSDGAAAADIYLREEGYDYFPVLVPCWDKNSTDSYGTNSLGMVALADAKQLAYQTLTGMRAKDRAFNPATQTDASMDGEPISLVPGHNTFVSNLEKNGGIRPIYNVNPYIDQMRLDIQDTRAILARDLLADLFLMMSNDDRAQPRTAAEIYERKSEKLLMLGPAYGRFEKYFLRPLVQIIFNIRMEMGRVNPAPPEMEGQELEIEFMSIMSMAMKMAGIERNDKIIQTLVTLQPIIPEVVDTVDEVILMGDMGDKLNLKNGIIRTPEKIVQRRQARQQAEAAAAQAETLEKASVTAKNLSQAPLDNDSVLSEMLQQSKVGSAVPT